MPHLDARLRRESRLDDPEGLAAEAGEGRLLGFDGKSIITQPDRHRPRAFDPTEAELEDARALIAAASGGRSASKDRMIEDMHVEQAKLLLARAGV